MKLKIRVKKEDFILFLLVCVILFIGCLILAANFISFGTTEQFVGLNVFKNFSVSTLGLAIILFIISLVVIIISIITVKYINYKSEQSKIKKENLEYEICLNK